MLTTKLACLVRFHGHQEIHRGGADVLGTAGGTVSEFETASARCLDGCCIRKGPPIGTEPEGSRFQPQGPSSCLCVAAAADVAGADEDEADHPGTIDGLEPFVASQPMKPLRRAVPQPGLLATMVFRHSARPFPHQLSHRWLPSLGSSAKVGAASHRTSPRCVWGVGRRTLARHGWPTRPNFYGPAA